MSTQGEVLARHGIANAEALVTAAIATDVPLFVAAAFAQAESDGEMIYGHDRGGTFTQPGKRAVTEENYKEFYRLVITQGGQSNGVGAMQITWKPYLLDAAKRGYRLWEPYDNFRYGLAIVKGYLGAKTDPASIASAGRRYNSGSDSRGVDYGNRVAEFAKVWASRLGTAPPAPPTPPKPPKAPTAVRYPLPSGHWFGIEDKDPHNHSGFWARDVLGVKVLQTRLEDRGWTIGVTGKFDARTLEVIRAFQKEKGLTVDGHVGPITWKALWTAKIT